MTIAITVINVRNLIDDFHWDRIGLVGMLNDVAYQANTREFWNSASAVCDQRDYRINGTFRDGKGQPGQISAVSHGCATTRFDRVNVINTARSLG